MSNQPDQQDAKKTHTWEPGTLIVLKSEETFDIGKITPSSTPLFPGPRGRQKAFKQVPYGEVVMYVDSDGERQSLMIQVVHGEDVGWTYFACGRTIP